MFEVSWKYEFPVYTLTGEDYSREVILNVNDGCLHLVGEGSGTDQRSLPWIGIKKSFDTLSSLWWLYITVKLMNVAHNMLRNIEMKERPRSLNSATVTKPEESCSKEFIVSLSDCTVSLGKLEIKIRTYDLYFREGRRRKQITFIKWLLCMWQRVS